MDNFPFITARSQYTIQLVNVKTGFCQDLVNDKCDSNWYQQVFDFRSLGDYSEITFVSQQLDGNFFEIRKIQLYEDFFSYLKIGHLPFSNFQEFQQYNQIKHKERKAERKTAEQTISNNVKELQEMMLKQNEEIAGMRQQIDKLIQLFLFQKKEK